MLELSFVNLYLIFAGLMGASAAMAAVWVATGVSAFRAYVYAALDARITELNGGQPVSRRASLVGHGRRFALSVINPFAGMRDDTITWAREMQRQARLTHDESTRRLSYVLVMSQGRTVGHVDSSRTSSEPLESIAERRGLAASRQLVNAIEAAPTMDALRAVMRGYHRRVSAILVKALHDQRTRRLCTPIGARLLDFGGRGTVLGLLLSLFLSTGGNIDQTMTRTGALTMVGGALGLTMFAASMIRTVVQVDGIAEWTVLRLAGKSPEVFAALLPLVLAGLMYGTWYCSTALQSLLG
ncbi:hypothetical protein ACFYV7_38100 [Nocardia suismassiliense]|uniref:Flp pilus assembly protein TadB n=1 Tax=Nocardia suismassiliense TaxID=2077092 RepID=A0ABW6R559_9NOCA